tara:strand:+ start:2111 stop:2773 length:663 start_codon:yes stop_codon:yes gene_type:complete
MAYDFLKELGITEAGQFRTKSRTDKMDAQQIKDFAFMDLNTLYMMYNEPAYREQAQAYAAETLKSRSFDRARISSTDLYNAIYQSKQAGAKINEPELKQYLGGIASGRMASGQARGQLQRLETSLGIKDSRLKSIRRRTQDYAKLSNSNKRVLMPLVNKWYHENGRYGQLYSTVQLMGSAGGTLTRAQIEKPGVWDKVKKNALTLGAIGATAYMIGRKGS